jgi:hypothetical protein
MWSALDDRSALAFYPFWSRETLAMRTTVLAYVIAGVGLIMVLGGIWALFTLFLQTIRAAKAEPFS